jgi:hypothetical protein
LQKEKVANQQKLSKHFAKHLPALLEQCKTEPDQIEELVELPQYFDFDTYHTDRLEKVPFPAHPKTWQCLACPLI